MLNGDSLKRSNGHYMSKILIELNSSILSVPALFDHYGITNMFITYKILLQIKTVDAQENIFQRLEIFRLEIKRFQSKFTKASPLTVFETLF